MTTTVGPISVGKTAALPNHRIIRIRGLAWMVHQRSARVVAVLSVLLACAFVVSLSLGEVVVSPTEVLDILAGGDSTYRTVIEVLRLPRVITGLVAGAAFGLAGAFIQTVARNPLASPDYLGITHGASAAAVAAIVLGAGTTVVPVAAAIGGVSTAVAIYLLAWRSGLQAGRFVLVGVALSFALNRLTDLMLAQDEVTAAQQAKVWLTGTINGRGWPEVTPLLFVFAVTIPLLLWAPRGMRNCVLSDDVAIGLGVRLGRVRLLLVGLGVVYAVSATAAVGPVAFISLMSPQVAKRLCRTGTAGLVCSALVGAFLVVVADLLARQAFDPYELPVGVLTAVLGAPYLLFLLARSRIGGFH